jgi:hypothetical protein
MPPPAPPVSEMFAALIDCVVVVPASKISA